MTSQQSQATAPAAANPVLLISAETVSALLQDAGYRGRVHSANYVHSAANGRKFLILVRPDGWLVFALSIANNGRMDLAGINNFNRIYRYCRAYLDAENDVVLEADYYLTGDFPTVFAVFIDVWDGLIATLVTYLREYDGRPLQAEIPPAEVAPAEGVTAAPPT